MEPIIIFALISIFVELGSAPSSSSSSGADRSLSHRVHRRRSGRPPANHRRRANVGAVRPHRLRRLEIRARRRSRLQRDGVSTLEPGAGMSLPLVAPDNSDKSGRTQNSRARAAGTGGRHSKGVDKLQIPARCAAGSREPFGKAKSATCVATSASSLCKPGISTPSASVTEAMDNSKRGRGSHA